MRSEVRYPASLRMHFQQGKGQGLDPRKLRAISYLSQFAFWDTMFHHTLGLGVVHTAQLMLDPQYLCNEFNSLINKVCPVIRAKVIWDAKLRYNFAA